MREPAAGSRIVAYGRTHAPPLMPGDLIRMFRKSPLRAAAAALLLTVASSLPIRAADTTPVSPGTPGSPGFEALDYAFRFASAIVSDPKDRGAAQESVVGELI